MTYKFICDGLYLPQLLVCNEISGKRILIDLKEFKYVSLVTTPPM